MVVKASISRLIPSLVGVSHLHGSWEPSHRHLSPPPPPDPPHIINSLSWIQNAISRCEERYATLSRFYIGVILRYLYHEPAQRSLYTFYTQVYECWTAGSMNVERRAQ
jgi:hypothetical protein